MIQIGTRARLASAQEIQAKIRALIAMVSAGYT